MDAVERLISRRWEGVGLDTFFKFSNLDRPIQQYLQRVYATLCVALLVSALGCVADLHYNIAGVLTVLTAFVCLFGLTWTPSTPQTLNTRYALLAGFSFCQGASLGKLVGLAVDVNPGLLLSALLGTATIFVCFTLASLLSTRRSFLFLGGWLASAIFCLLAVRLGGLLAGSRGGNIAFQAELYGGLLVFSGYVLLDTQLIVEKAAVGYQDHVKAALDLQVDLLAIFARVLILLLRNQMKRAEKEQRGRRGDRKRSE